MRCTVFKILLRTLDVVYLFPWDSLMMLLHNHVEAIVEQQAIIANLLIFKI